MSCPKYKFNIEEAGLDCELITGVDEKGSTTFGNWIDNNLFIIQTNLGFKINLLNYKINDYWLSLENISMIKKRLKSNKINDKNTRNILEYIINNYQKYINWDVIKKHEEYENKKWRKQYEKLGKEIDILKQAYEELGYKKDAKDIEELKKIPLYEATALVENIYNRISKKKTMKSIKLYAKIKEIQNIKINYK